MIDSELALYLGLFLSKVFCIIFPDASCCGFSLVRHETNKNKIQCEIHACRSCV